MLEATKRRFRKWALSVASLARTTPEPAPPLRERNTICGPTSIFTKPQAHPLHLHFGPAFPTACAWAAFCKESGATNSLDFSGMWFKRGEFLDMLRSLTAFTKLRTLKLADLQGPGIENTVVGTGWAHAVARLLLSGAVPSRAVSSLDISGNDIRVEGAKELAMGLRRHIMPSLHRLRFTGFSAHMSSVSVQVTTSLTEANFARRGLGPSGAALLFGVLPRCKSLKRLDISHNQLRFDGAGVVRNYLLVQPDHLAYLNLAHNELNRNWKGEMVSAGAWIFPRCAKLRIDISGNEGAYGAHPHLPSDMR
jgi:hypothetical protein